MPQISGGYILLSRKLIESRIMSKPPLYLKVWVWLLLQAQHRTYKGLKRGQLITTIPEVQEAMSYMSGYRKEKPTYKQIRRIFDWLRCPDGRACGGQDEGTMVVITEGNQKMLVTVCNYEVYQDPANYEGQAEGQDGAPTGGTRGDDGREAFLIYNKNDKNDKKKYAEFVWLKEAEYAKLVEKHGEPFVNRCIEILNNYKGSKGRKYKSDYHAILNWVTKRAKEEMGSQVKPFQHLPDLRKDVNYAPF